MLHFFKATGSYLYGTTTALTIFDFEIGGLFHPSSQLRASFSPPTRNTIVPFQHTFEIVPFWKQMNKKMVQTDMKNQSKLKQRFFVVLEWIFLAIVVTTYQSYLESTLELPSDNEGLLFGQHQLIEKSSNPNAHLKIVIRSTGGRLGNNMFQYASSMAIAQDLSKKLDNPSTLCMHPEFNLPNLTDAFVGPFVDDCSPDDVKSMWEINDFAYAKHHDIVFPPCSEDRCSFALKGYYQSWKYFDEYKKSVRDIFQFKQPIIEEARAVLNTPGYSAAVITVGLHIRKGDMNQNRHFYLRDPPLSYYEKAMDHFRDEYGSIRFVVVSDDPDWCEAQPIFKDTQIISNNAAALDMAVLSMCHHVILSRGSFGWWAAYLTGTKAIYYKDMFVMSHPENFGKVNRDDHFPSDWIGMK